VKRPKPKTFSEGVYAIDCKHSDSGRQEVAGRVHSGGLLAIHKDPVLGYVVDHRPTGLFIADFKTLNAAKRFVVAIAGMHWDFKDPEEAKDEGFRKEVEEIYESVNSKPTKEKGNEANEMQQPL